jgi:hypothetical protein
VTRDTARPITPRPASDLRFWPALRAAGRLWWHNLSTFGLIAVAAVLPVVALVQFLTHRLDTVAGPVRVAVLLVGGVAVAAFGEALCAGLAEHVAYRDRTGRQRRPLWTQARRLPLPTLAALAIVVAVAVAVGIASFVVPGIVAFAWLMSATPAASFERLRAGAALRRGFALTRGRFRQVFPLSAATFVPVAAADAVAVAVHEKHPPTWVLILVEVVVEAIAITLTAAVVVVVYHALRERAPVSSR